MTLEFRDLPQTFAVGKDDELILVDANGAKRITGKSLFADNVALVHFKHPSDQNYGIGTANTWIQIPFNNLDLQGGNAWVNLNPNGSLTFQPGIYTIELSISIRASGHSRLKMNLDGVVRAISGDFGSTAEYSLVRLSVDEKIVLAVPATVEFELAVATASTTGILIGDSFLAGNQTTICTCKIVKFG